MKRNVLNTLVVFCFIILPATILYQSCRKQDVSAANRYDLTTEDGKAIFNTAKLELQNKFAGTYGTLQPQWQHSKIKASSARDAVMYTPIGFNNETGAYLQLITMKNKGKLRSIITEMKPDADYYAKRGARNFYDVLNGKLLFYTVTGNFIKGFTMQKGLSQGRYFPDGELDKPSVLNRSSGAQNSLTDPDPCEGNWGNFGCQELETVVVSARPVSGGDIIFISLPINIFYAAPSGGEYGGYQWSPLGDPTGSDGGDYPDLGMSYERPCPSSFRFKNLTSTMREALVYGIRFELYSLPSTTPVNSVTFGLTIDMPSDLVFQAEYNYTRLRALYYGKLSDSDLRLTGPDAEGNKHLIISQAAQTMFAVDAVHDTNVLMKEGGFIQLLNSPSTSGFKIEYKNELETFIQRIVPGSRIQVLNSNVPGTTPYRSTTMFGC